MAGSTLPLASYPLDCEVNELETKSLNERDDVGQLTFTKKIVKLKKTFEFQDLLFFLFCEAKTRSLVQSRQKITILKSRRPGLEELSIPAMAVAVNDDCPRQ